MITLTKSGNAIVFTFDDNDHYLNDGIIEVPVNSLTLVTDESQMATFKRSSTNDIFISARYDELGMSKSDLESWFKENACGSTGGGGGVTSGEVQTMIDESISGKADISDVAIVSSDVQTLSEQVETDEKVTANALVDLDNRKLDASAYTPTDLSNYYTKSQTNTQINSATNGLLDAGEFNEYTASNNERVGNIEDRLSEDEEVTSAALNELNEALSGKQDTLSAGTNITISGNVISAEGGTVDQAFDRVSTNAIANSAVTRNTVGSYSVDMTDGKSFLQAYDQKGYGLDNLSLGFSRINGRNILQKASNIRILTNFDLVETSAITSSVTSASTDSQVPSAKAVYDALQEGGGLPESAFTAYTASTDARISEDEEVTAAALNALDETKADASDLGGLKLVSLTQAQYDALATKDASTLYIITNNS